MSACSSSVIGRVFVATGRLGLWEFTAAERALSPLLDELGKDESWGLAGTCEEVPAETGTGRRIEARVCARAVRRVNAGRQEAPARRRRGMKFAPMGYPSFQTMARQSHRPPQNNITCFPSGQGLGGRT